MASITRWIIANGAEVSVGDEVIGVAGCRGRITAVARVTGYPMVTYESGELAGTVLAAHPSQLTEKVR